MNQQVLHHQQQVLQHLGVLIEFLMRDENATTRQCLEFAYRLRLCIESDMLWEEFERLISRAQRDWPVLLRPLSTGSNYSSISDILYDPTYVVACRREAEAVTGNGDRNNEDIEEGSEDNDDLPELVSPDSEE
ncbi:hypothetical protein QCA50_000985 [Cerrena zonata]|uniref:Uncharacterized protein n=1 Tax=Cerrena zonata TaxID=2478898 RepID=A0AAW0H0L8_9APHY